MDAIEKAREYISHWSERKRRCAASATNCFRLSMASRSKLRRASKPIRKNAEEGGMDDETRDCSAVVCPWCGHRHRDSWEMVDFRDESGIDGECGQCEKPIRFRVETHHVYICERAEAEIDAGANDVYAGDN